MNRTRPTLSEVRSWAATVSVAEAARAIGCSKSHLHQRIKRGDSPVKTIPFGARVVVITADLVRLLSGEPTHAQLEAESGAEGAA
ncbi:DNA-binding protein [Streptomyces sp. NBC_00096]|uniref:DNA-binding protein n=1 Tax=Streptomyces sp. NBC_00096 TaxID=2975650 RepID=UPI00325577CF